jgi:ESS family glutamate:Na+ symporter
MSLTLSAWWLLFAAIPVLFLGETIVRRVPFLAKYNIPVPVVGGLAICLLILLGDVTGLYHITLLTKVQAPWWTWIVTPEPEWKTLPQKAANLPFLIGFFTCIGLTATWDVLKKGSWQVPLFWGLATLLAVLQNALGVSVAYLLGENPLLGLICGSLSQTGGHGTALGFADTLIQAGYPSAATAGAAASTFGLVCGGLIGGPIAARLIRQHQLLPQRHSAADNLQAMHAEEEIVEATLHEKGIGQSLRAMVKLGPSLLGHVVFLIALIKAGAWVSFGLQATGMVFPAYMGAMLVGVIVRNVLLLCGISWIDAKVIDALSGLMLGIFLATAMMSLNLKELAASAGPMLVILAAQILLVWAFVRWVTFPLMGKDYDAAVIVAGHCGFAHGATPNAVANMDSICRSFSPSQRAFLIVPIVGGMLIDLTNSLNITWFLNFLK